MKKIYSFVMVASIAITANAQLVINENFTGYTNGNLSVGTSNGWVANGTTNDVQVRNDVPLTHTGYTSGSQFIRVASLNGTDPHKPFSVNVSTTAPQTIWMSFVVRAINVAELRDGPNFTVSLANTTNSTFPCEFYMGEHNGSSNAFEFGIATGTGSPNYTSNSYEYGTTYLIVIRYDFISGSNNDKVYLWVNPSLTSEPTTGTAAATMTGGEVGYGSALNALKLSQSDNTDSPDADYDAFRVASGSSSALAWSNLSPVGAPLPVVLTSFNAAAEGLTTKLVWNVVEELNLSNYVVERSIDGRTYTGIGTVKAVNQKTYSFVDGQPASDNSYYRLKMVDNDGNFKFSYIVSIKSKLNVNISLSPNPVKNMLMIQHPKVVSNGHIQIISANGQLLRDVRLSANAVLSNVDMSGLASGLYHVVFRNGADMFSKTVIKQ